MGKLDISAFGDNTLADFKFEEVDWIETSEEIKTVRQKVFIVEQHFETRMIEDHHDNYCHHILVRNRQNKVVACGRLNPDGRIGRIAVLMNYRCRGIGTAILDKLIAIAQQTQIPSLSLNAETELSQFYNQQKFRPVGPVFMKQGVPYQRMSKRLG